MSNLKPKAYPSVWLDCLKINVLKVTDYYVTVNTRSPSAVTRSVTQLIIGYLTYNAVSKELFSF
jgi:Ni,Fe-hydrogenase I cytochrome b subunit